jgi:hypothetical protein
MTLGKKGKDKPLIIWELPWEGFFNSSSSSKVEYWQAYLHEFRTHISHELKISWA